MATRDSQTDPQYVDFIIGGLGLTGAPGKHQPTRRDLWARDLDVDIRQLRHPHGCEMLVTLNEPQELDRWSISHLPTVCAQHCIEHRQFPIREAATPDLTPSTLAFITDLATTLRHGTTVVIHCGGGLGRAGTIAACLLLHTGWTPQDAVGHVRRRRRGAIESDAQADFVHRYASYRGGPTDLSVAPLTKRHWIFDLDGTLTQAAHDFPAIRRQLGVPAERPILEDIAARPSLEQLPLLEQLHAIEEDIARTSRIAPYARRLLNALEWRGASLGIVTRNSRSNAEVSLGAIGLARFFPSASIVGREDCTPKPAPDGPQELLRRWQVEPHAAIMVGDYRYDLEAAAAANIEGVLVRRGATPPWCDVNRHQQDLWHWAASRFLGVPR